jgi:hypothetical protein
MTKNVCFFNHKRYQKRADSQSFEKVVKKCTKKHLEAKQV